MQDINAYNFILERFKEDSVRIFGKQLVGIYLHGSAAMDCFNSEKSDIDLLFIVDGSIAESRKLDFLKTVIELNAYAPPKGIELSIIKNEYCKPFVYPTPYDFHFSNTYRYEAEMTPVEFVRKMHGTDRDLAAHIMVTYNRGRTLFGRDIHDVFEAPSSEYYLDSIMYDVENAEDDISANPMYLTLNLCRVLAYVKEGLILSKKEGGEWGLSVLPDVYKSIVSSALGEYTNNIRFFAGESELKEYAAYMLKKIKSSYRYISGGLL